VIGEGQILVDRLDARAPGVERRIEAMRPPVEPDIAIVRLEGAGQRLDQS